MGVAGVRPSRRTLGWRLAGQLGHGTLRCSCHGTPWWFGCGYLIGRRSPNGYSLAA